jgi:hypothetical protein
MASCDRHLPQRTVSRSSDSYPPRTWAAHLSYSVPKAPRLTMEEPNGPHSNNLNLAAEDSLIRYGGLKVQKMGPEFTQCEGRQYCGNDAVRGPFLPFPAPRAFEGVGCPSTLSPSKTEANSLPSNEPRQTVSSWSPRGHQYNTTPALEKCPSSVYDVRRRSYRMLPYHPTRLKRCREHCRSSRTKLSLAHLWSSADVRISWVRQECCISEHGV